MTPGISKQGQPATDEGAMTDPTTDQYGRFEDADWSEFR
jgi:hypothetical protein